MTEKNIPYIHMVDSSNHNTDRVDKKSAFEYFTEVMDWMQIMASPFLAGLIIGAIIYLSNPNRSTLIISVIMATIGLTVGVIWATRVWRKKGTIHFMSRIMRTPVLEKKEEDQD